MLNIRGRDDRIHLNPLIAYNTSVACYAHVVIGDIRVGEVSVAHPHDIGCVRAYVSLLDPLILDHAV